MDYNQPKGRVPGYTLTVGFGLTPSSPYIDGDPSIPQPGSIPTAASIDFPQREIVGAELAAGLLPTNNDLTQLTQAIKLLGRIPTVNDVGVANHLVVNPVPAITAYVIPITLLVKVAVTSTGPCDINVSGLGAVPLTRTDGSALQANDLPIAGEALVAYDGTKFQLISVPGSLAFPQPQQLDHYGVDISPSANTIIASLADSIGSSWPTGVFIAIKVANKNTGPTTVVLNGLAPINLQRGSGLPLSTGDVDVGYIAFMIFDGTEAQLINPLAGIGAGGGTVNDITGPDRPYWLAVNSIGVTSPPGSPSLGDTYLVPLTASGSWSGLGNRLSQWNGTGWVSRTYPSGSVIAASDTLRVYQNIGSGWPEVQLMTLGKLFFYNQL